MSHASQFLSEAKQVIDGLDVLAIERMAILLEQARERGGRLFILGVGGSAANASHAVNDFRKIAQIEAYAPTDNVSELTAWTNDSGWDSVFINWLKGSRLNDKDAILVYSVGGGDAERNISANIVKAIDLAKARSAKVFGIVGRDSGYTARHGDVVVVIPQINPNWVTPLSEAFQAVVWHCLVSHPSLQRRQTKW